MHASGQVGQARFAADDYSIEVAFRNRFKALGRVYDSISVHQRGGSWDRIDWDRVISDVQAGVPVILVTSRHYYVAEGYDAATGKFDFGNSGAVLAAARKGSWFRPDELTWLGLGSPFTTIHRGPAPQPSEYTRATNVRHGGNALGHQLHAYWKQLPS